MCKIVKFPEMKIKDLDVKKTCSISKRYCTKPWYRISYLFSRLIIFIQFFEVKIMFLTETIREGVSYPE